MVTAGGLKGVGERADVVGEEALEELDGVGAAEAEDGAGGEAAGEGAHGV